MTRRELALLLATGAAALAARVPTLAQPLVEDHAFRQTQTAYTALLFHQGGIDLLRPKLPTLAASGDFPLELPLFQANAALVMGAGVPPDAAMRLTALFWWLVTAVLLWLLVRRIGGTTAATAAWLAFIASPFGLIWSRASLIEYLATAGAVGAAWTGIAWRASGARAHWTASVALATVAMLVKPSTALFWLAPQLLHRGEREGPWLRSRLRPASLALAAVPAAAAVPWVLYGDAVRRADIATAFTTGAEQREILFGTLAQRFDLGQWATALTPTVQLVVGAPLVPFAIAGAWYALRSRDRLAWLGVLVAALGPLVAFFDLYAHHEYYQAAISPALSALVGMGAAWLIARWPARARPRATALLVTAGALALVLAAPAVARIYGGVVDPEGILPRAAELAGVSRADDRVLVLGRSYSPAIHYYARRRGLALPPALAEQDRVDDLVARGFDVVAAWDPYQDPVVIARHWPWTGAIGPRQYAVAAAPAGLRGARVRATDDVAAFDAAARRGRPLAGVPAAIPCDGRTVALPPASAATWLRLDVSGLDPRSLVILDGALAPLPARTVVAATGAAAIACTRGGTLRVLAVVDASLE